MSPVGHNFDLNTVVSRVTPKSIILEFASIIRQSLVINSRLLWVCFPLANNVVRDFQPIETIRSTRFDVKFFRVLSKNSHQGMLHCILFSPEKLALLCLFVEAKPSPGRNISKLVTFDSLFPL